MNRTISAIVVRGVFLAPALLIISCAGNEEKPKLSMTSKPEMIQIPTGMLTRLEQQKIRHIDTVWQAGHSMRLDTMVTDTIVRSIIGHIKSFSVSRFEITQEQWESVMGSNPSRFKGTHRPVENITYEQAEEFCQRLNAQEGLPTYTYRLLAATEWEYACRAGVESDFYIGMLTTDLYDCHTIDPALDKAAWYCANAKGCTHTVGLKEPNNFGLYDMHGNVAEWVAGGSHDMAMTCGGSWNESPAMASASHRFTMQFWKHSVSQDNATSYIGLRIAK